MSSIWIITSPDWKPDSSACDLGSTSEIRIPVISVGNLNFFWFSASIKLNFNPPRTGTELSVWTSARLEVLSPNTIFKSISFLSLSTWSTIFSSGLKDAIVFCKEVLSFTAFPFIA